MSLIRACSQFEYMKGESPGTYIYISDKGVEDYGEVYDNPVLMCELIGRLADRWTEDDEWVKKFVKATAKLMGVEKELQ